MNISYDGKLWMREIFLKAQIHAIQISKFTGIFVSIPTSALPMLLDLIMTDEADRHEDFWAYNLVGFLINWYYFNQNITFLVIAFNSANRMNYMMTALSNSLEICFSKKNAISVFLPTINFLEPESLQAWLETRRLTLDLGYRYQVRLQMFMSGNLIAVGCSIALLFAVGSGFIDQSIMSKHLWIVLGIETGFMALMCLLVLLPLSYINKQTQY